MHKRQSTNLLVDLSSLKMLLICSTLNTSSDGSGGRCHWAREPAVHFWRQSSHVILAISQGCRLSAMLLFPTGLRMLYVRCNVLWRTRSRKVTETLTSDQNGEKETKVNSRSDSQLKKEPLASAFRALRTVATASRSFTTLTSSHTVTAASAWKTREGEKSPVRSAPPLFDTCCPCLGALTFTFDEKCADVASMDARFVMTRLVLWRTHPNLPSCSPKRRSCQ